MIKWSIKSSCQTLAMRRKMKDKENQSDVLPHSTKALSIQNRQVSWLVTFLPSFPSRKTGTVDKDGQKPFSLLTVAGQLVICTQFPINPGITRGPSLFDEKLKKELYGAKLGIWSMPAENLISFFLSAGYNPLFVLSQQASELLPMRAFPLQRHPGW